MSYFTFGFSLAGLCYTLLKTFSITQIVFTKQIVFEQETSLCFFYKDLGFLHIMMIYFVLEKVMYKIFFLISQYSIYFRKPYVEYKMKLTTGR